MLGSSIDTDLDVSIYEIARRGEKFDIVLCLGLYCHLVDPFYAFAQIRHCCRADSIIVFEGDVTFGLPPNLMRYDLSTPSRPYFVPTPKSLTQMLEACYFETVPQRWMIGAQRLSWRRWLRMQIDIIHGRANSLPELMDRPVTVCRPFEGSNRVHFYRPPFGLHRYDPQFRDARNAPAKGGDAA